MENLVDQDPAQLAWIEAQGFVENNLALANEAGGVDFIAALAATEQSPLRDAQRGCPFNSNWRSQ